MSNISTLDSHQDVRRKCQEDFESHLGKILLANIVITACDERACSPPARVRVIDTDMTMICKWTDHEHCDPLWNVELLEYHPALAGFSYLRIAGISHSTYEGANVIDDAWRLDDDQTVPENIDTKCIKCLHTLRVIIDRRVVSSHAIVGTNKLGIVIEEHPTAQDIIEDYERYLFCPKCQRREPMPFYDNNGEEVTIQLSRKNSDPE